MFFSSKSHSLTNTTILRRTALLVAIATSIGAACSVPRVSATSLGVHTPLVSASTVKSSPVRQFSIAQSRTQESVQGIIYAVMDNGDLKWYRHDGRADGTFRWTAGDGGKKVGTGWNFKQVFSGGDGIIYGIKDNGDLMWYRHDGRADGTFRWTAGDGGKKVGTGWNFKQVFSGGDGIIYG
ncbi:tachylectin-related carbohydrate-binding protein, partial [Coleofasciculus sp. H7-2]|uniref:tachylectin-related carbohydrate-binding protein n=1 Tax=Coleofasciculus sp. H7-2 TaxID=3351545 RepID=UPI00367242B8